ncbi:MAG: hypothetical protein AAGH88_01450 [Planctomycetota bacterium]
MRTLGCSNLTIAYLQQQLYGNETMCCDAPACDAEATGHHPDWSARTDRVECSPESLAMGKTAGQPPTSTLHRETDLTPPESPQASEPPPIYERPIVLAVLTPVVQGSMLDIIA